jgi:hypothetical protein
LLEHGRARPPRRAVRLAVLALLPITLSGATAGAQTLAGRAVDRVTQLAARDVAVEVLSERDSIVSRTRTDTLGEFYANLSSPGTFRLRFRVDSVHTFDSAPMTLGLGELVQNLFVINIAEILFDFQVDKQVEMAPHNVPPKYPEVMRWRNIDGEVLAQFVVDTTGFALLETFRPIRYSNMEFVQAVRAALPTLRYIPAEKGGHRVRQLIQQPFTFSFSGGPERGAPDRFIPPPGRGSVDPSARRWP